MARPKNEDEPADGELVSRSSYDRLTVAGSAPLRLEAVAAVHGLIAARIEGHFGDAAATVTGRGEHLALATSTTAAAHA
uniref:Uncharacterized protein n=1 Tax=mine drainage metagenome TaxID=410659 RepID=E6PDF8_9ZZZZ